MLHYILEGRISPNYHFLVTKRTQMQNLIKHTHDFVEIVLPTKGNGLHYVNDFGYPFAANTLYLIDTQSSHHTSIPTEFEYLEVIIDSDFYDAHPACQSFNHFFEQAESPAIELAEEQNKLAHGILEILIGEFAIPNVSSDILLNLLDAFLLTISTATPIKPVLSEKNTRNVGALGILDYITTNFTEDISLKNIAKIYHFNASHLSRLIKKKYGLTYSELLHLLRINASKRLLVNSDEPISKIAYSVGFGSVPQFYKCFQKQTGVTPKEYRDSSRKNFTKEQIEHP